MADPPQRQPSKSRFATTVIEKNEAPPPREVVTAKPVPRVPTPVGMPAPPHAPEPDTDRQSYDDLEHVLQLEKLERERAQLLAKLQDSEERAAGAERERDRLREQAPVAIFPPESIRPPKPAPVEVQQAVIEGDIERIQKAVVKSRLGRGAITLGVLLALGWNAFNSARIAVPTQKAEAIQARQAQTEHLSAEDIKQRTLESERNYQRWRATYCALKQLRGASARQGLDLPSLPPGGVKALRLGDEDPNRPGPPRFVAEEVCPEFPALPPETRSQ